MYFNKIKFTGRLADPDTVCYPKIIFKYVQTLQLLETVTPSLTLTVLIVFCLNLGDQKVIFNLKSSHMSYKFNSLHFI